MNAFLPVAAALILLAAGLPVPLERVFSPDQDFALVLPQLDALEGTGGLRAADCGTCHRPIYAEWREATHAMALRDLQFQAELFKPENPRWLCLNCHIPVENQRRALVEGLENGDVLRPVTAKNPGFDPTMQPEGVSCASCHLRRDDRGQTVVIGTRGNRKAYHPVRADREFLHASCERCHDPQGERITPLLVCWFETFAELGGRKKCIDCHMPGVRRRLAPDYPDFPERDNRHHFWVGGGVPKRYSRYDSLLERGYRPGADFRLTAVRRFEHSVSFALEVTNSRAGHFLPTADPERFLLLEARLINRPTGRTGAQMAHRIGQVWKWSPRAEKVSDNRLKPGETRTWKETLAVPLVPGPWTLSISVLHVRLTSPNAAHMQKARVQNLYLADLTEVLPELQRHYPMASWVFRQDVELPTGRRRIFGPEELIELSRKERSKPLSARSY